METFKLRVRIEPRAVEFEAEGEREVVERQFTNFQEFVRTTPMAKGIAGAEERRALGPGADADEDDRGEEEDAGSPPPAETTGIWASEAAEFKPIFGTDGQVVYLSAPPHTANGEPDVGRSGLLLVYGYRLYKNIDGVSGSQLMEGLNKSGFSVLRADRVLDAYIGGPDAELMRFGKKRGVKYRLTNRGLNTVRALAREINKMMT